MMANVMSSLIVSLIDRVTGPAKAVANSVKGISQAAAAASNGGLAKVAEANAAALGRMRASMLEAVAAAYVLKQALTAPLSTAGAFQSIMLDIGQKADLGDGAIKRIGGSLRTLAPQVNQTAQEAAKALDSLVGFGLDPNLAMKLLSPMGKAATAYRASLDDIAKASFSITDNMKVPIEQLTKALDIMAQSGKMGAFELKDMAAEFPALTAAAGALEMKGTLGVARLTAALQIARKGAATGAEAATNTANLMQKIASPDSVNKFAKFGIDIRKELKKTQDAGGDVFEMIAVQVNRATKGDLAKLGDVFQDAEVQKFLRPLLANLPEYRRVRDEALKAEGVVDADFARRMKTFDARVKGMMSSLEEFGLIIGEILIEPVERLVDVLKPAVVGLGDVAKANPALVGALIKSATAIIAVSIAAKAAAWSFLFMKGGVLMIVAPLLKAALAMGTFTASMATAAYAGVVAGLARLRAGLLSIMVLGAVGGPAAVFRALGAALMGLLSPIGLVAGAMKLLKLAVISTGIGAVLVAIAMAGLWIYENWAGLGAFFKSFGAAFMSALGPLASAVTPLIDTVKRLWDTVAGFFGEISPETWTRWGTSAGTAVGDLVRTVMDLPGRIAGLGETLFATGGEWMGRLYDGALSGVQNLTALIAWIPRQFMELGGPTGEALYNAGVAGMRRFWDGLREIWASIVGWVKGEVATIAESFASTFSFLPWAPKRATAPVPSNDNAPGASTSPRLKRAAPRVIGNPDDPAVGGSGGEDLNGSIGPSADLSGVRSARQEVAALKKEIAEVNSTPIRIGASVAGGGVARALRSEFNDAGM